MNKFLVTLLGLVASLCANAEIYKQVDADGHVTYSNVPMKGSTRLNLEPAPPNTARPASERGSRPTSTATPAGFPKVDKDTQKGRDDKRKQILEQELAAEKKALEEAKANHAEAESNPEVFQRTVTANVCNTVVVNGKPTQVCKDVKRTETGRNVAKFDEKMEKARQEVELHQKNIELLEKELGNIK